MISLEELNRIMPFARHRADAAVEPLNETMRRYGIDNILRQSAFLAQVAHESGELRYTEEIASGEAYEDRIDLGNTELGDGKRYKGRGYFQITGRANYKACGEDLELDLINHPELLETTANAALSAGWFWDKKHLNELADKPDFVLICKRINGGLNGYKSRLDYYERAKQVLGGE